MTLDELAENQKGFIREAQWLGITGKNELNKPAEKRGLLRKYFKKCQPGESNDVSKFNRAEINTMFKGFYNTYIKKYKQ